MEIFGAAITLLSVVLAYLAWTNGRWMKETVGRMDERTALQTEILSRMDEHSIKMDERLAKMDEHLVKISELIKTEADRIVAEVRR